MKVFLTGATGFLGGELLIELSKLLSVEKVFCLVRAENQEKAQERIKKVFAFHGDFYDEDKVEAIVGSLSDNSLSEKLKENPKLSQVNIVIHSGANTSFLPQERRSIEATNVNGAVQVATWASSLKKLETFVYVGTAMIAGANPEMIGRIIFEDESPNLNSKHIVAYTYSKMIGEIKVKEIIPKEKILVVRPSAILGDSRMWKPRSFDVAWVFSALNDLRLCPFKPEYGVDLIPVDYASSAIVRLIFSKRSYDCYHISAGKSAGTMYNILRVYEKNFNDRPEFCFTEADLIKEMKFFSKKKIDCCKLLSNGYSNYLEYWRENFGSNGGLRVLLAGLNKYLEFINLGQKFDNSRLVSEGIDLPEPVEVYVNRTMAFIKDIDVVESSTRNA